MLLSAPGQCTVNAEATAKLLTSPSLAQNEDPDRGSVTDCSFVCTELCVFPNHRPNPVATLPETSGSHPHSSLFRSRIMANCWNPECAGRTSPHSFGHSWIT